MEHLRENGEPVLRYPKTLTLIRHAQSQYNLLKKQVEQWESGQAFKRKFNDEFYEGDKPKFDLDIAVLEHRWPSPELRELAVRYYKDIKSVMKGVSDFDTPITAEGERQAAETGEHIAEHIEKPDIIYVSPYLRTRQTLDLILQNAPSDWKEIPKWENESVREQEYGMQTVSNDWKLSYVFEPMEMIHSIKQGPYSYRHKGGESKFDVRNRTSRFIGRLRRKHEGENVLAVTHHLTILATIGELLHWSREEFLKWDKEKRPDNCGVTIFRREEGTSRTGKDLLRLNPDEYSMKLYE